MRCHISPKSLLIAIIMLILFYMSFGVTFTYITVYLGLFVDWTACKHLSTKDCIRQCYCDWCNSLRDSFHVDINCAPQDCYSVLVPKCFMEPEKLVTLSGLVVLQIVLCGIFALIGLIWLSCPSTYRMLRRWLSKICVIYGNHGSNNLRKSEFRNL